MIASQSLPDLPLALMLHTNQNNSDIQTAVAEYDELRSSYDQQTQTSSVVYQMGSNKTYMRTWGDDSKVDDW
jgi:hypothetical protein